MLRHNHTVCQQVLKPKSILLTVMIIYSPSFPRVLVESSFHFPTSTLQSCRKQRKRQAPAESTNKPCLTSYLQSPSRTPFLQLPPQSVQYLSRDFVSPWWTSPVQVRPALFAGQFDIILMPTAEKQLELRHNSTR